MIAALRAGLASRVQGFAASAVAGAAERLTSRIAAELPDIAIETGDAEVRISAPGLRLRAFGSRRRAADPRLLAIIGGGR